MGSLSVSMSMLALYMCCFILNIDRSLSQSSNICLPKNHTALFIFGDSLFDAGNNDYINSATFFQANFPPYGETFFKYPSGRFSDGRVIPDFVAEYAKLPLIPPYLHPGYHGQYIYGVNFASAGAGALVETNKGLVIDLKTQALYFAQVSKQFKQKLGEEEAKKLLSRAVYIFSIGNNDYASPFYTNPNTTVVLPYSQQQFVDFVIGNTTSVIKLIVIFGPACFIRRIFIMKVEESLGLYTQDIWPSMFVNGTNIDACLEEEATALARLHNSALPKNLQKLEKELNGFRYSVTDTYTALLEVMEYPSKYGFKEGNAACCGGGPYRGDYSCGGKRGIEEYELCNNVGEHVFFDSLHPTDRAAEYFAKLMWSGNRDVTEPFNLKQLFDI